MTQRAFITGIGGFAGGHLAELCASEGASVLGLVRGAPPQWLAPQVEVHRADLADAAALRRILAEARPDTIFHLAAETGSADEGLLLASNVGGTTNLLEAAAALSPAPLVLVAGSSAVYGSGSAPGEPIREEAPLAPVSSYGHAKAAQEAVAERLGTLLGVRVVRARAFNQTGPRESDRFVASSIARQIAEIEAGLRAPAIAIGRTDTVRDFTDVRDIVRGYWLAAARGTAGEVYNLASGRGVAIAEIVDGLVARSRASIVVTEDPARMRPADVPVQVGDASKAEAALGWTAEIPLERTLGDLLDYWRREVRSG
jgi:GDP-4-dehydro-6-deoxy-D-mannose reductase